MANDGAFYMTNVEHSIRLLVEFSTWLMIEHSTWLNDAFYMAYD